ncbi:helix-turn-helix domain-containing protein [Clostridium tarantellae]|uniref:Helix-turn-helix domain-containing protein n=1 Tax=Clostridium tarantellae TaxID=39493 RepID=A0A6I1MPR4_9CLOT|nr:helix-turn-helix domain-containing protein [Clostridium tarantellae]MPQ44900.1 helix-turn-helix domain-containing protein [Clostridium tarantellae]
MRSKNELNKLEVKRLYLEGYNASEIAKVLGANKSQVQKCIQRNFKDLKKQNQIKKSLKSLEQKEIRKIINKEAKKYMSDRSFVEKNRSIYNTNIKGDIVLKKDLNFLIPVDVPKKLINKEFKKYL